MKIIPAMQADKQIVSFALILSLSLTPTVTCARQHYKEYKTRTGKSFFVRETHPNGQSLSTISVESSGFEYNVSEILEDSDPITEVLVEDLDNNGFDELYIITVSGGSGSYGSMVASISIMDKSISMISLPEMEKGDTCFTGYMGHDSFRVVNQSLVRTFPIYLPTDKNYNPTGGICSLSYSLRRNGAAWQLEVEQALLTK